MLFGPGAADVLLIISPHSVRLLERSEARDLGKTPGMSSDEFASMHMDPGDATREPQVSLLSNGAGACRPLRPMLAL